LLSEGERHGRLRQLEALLNRELRCHQTLADFQKHLYAIIEKDLCSSLGHWLGRWDYDCKIEIWGGKSYMDAAVEEQLLLRSEFPHGVRLAWGDYEALEEPNS